ncbi:MAG: hypothetical protein JW919_04740 [Candidatus Omnitrophica bacterium]|nr:hypothetical protein [Candidatus Omnitrophota bacterium]
MGNVRYTKAQRGVAQDPMPSNMFIERLKKIRALNSSPSLFGINSLMVKKIAKNIYLVTR